MDSLLSSPGMLAALALVLLMQAASLLLLLVNRQLFRAQSGRYKKLLADLGDVTAWKNPGRILFPVYFLLTVSITIATTTLFVWQPHIL
ncbi:hypothetical protein A3D88_03530 [Candidatus Peribacteria bacterium RIFCSPHIGHO2_02_FULL_52_16]|nr:MAG: hypothetical protein A2706_04345 [Candidatus Peribacteria bacterium RIFCSPHIGHO2_01_FULL_51_35]OGJ61756.1 MAG: hypothetical protein A3D88_03530 [Candidatus Peribacteria bacterium RIFCSPHIGHO2_02_FULL_52_16]